MLEAVAGRLEVLSYVGGSRFVGFRGLTNCICVDVSVVELRGREAVDSLFADLSLFYHVDSLFACGACSSGLTLCMRLNLLGEREDHR